MNYFSKYRYAIWTIVVLAVIIVTAVITTLILHYSCKNTPPQPLRFHDVNRLMHAELSLTPEQDLKIDSIQKDFRKINHPLFKEIEKKKEQMTEELEKQKPDTALLYQLSNDIGNLHNKLKHQALKNLLQIRSICNAQQIEKLNVITMKLLEPDGPPKKQEHSKEH